MNRVLTGLIELNGGAVVALLAFLQAMLKENKPVARVVLFGMIPLMIGLIPAIVFQTLRYFTSHADQKRKKQAMKKYVRSGTSDTDVIDIRTLPRCTLRSPHLFSECFL
jgi:hypothetical protein